MMIPEQIESSQYHAHIMWKMSGVIVDKTRLQCHTLTRLSKAEMEDERL